MPSVLVRNLPQDVVAALKRRAAAHHRSLQKELLSLLEKAADDAPPVEPWPALRLTLAPESTEADWSREAIYGDDGR